MAGKTRPRKSAAGKIAAVVRHHGTDDPRLSELRRDLHEAELAEHISRLVDQAPPLSIEQRAKLAALLLSVPSTVDGGGRDAA